MPLSLRESLMSSFSEMSTSRSMMARRSWGCRLNREFPFMASLTFLTELGTELGIMLILPFEIINNYFWRGDSPRGFYIYMSHLLTPLSPLCAPSHAVARHRG